MILEVTNKELSIGKIHIIGVSGSSIVLVGDTHSLEAISSFDTPPDSQIIGPIAPIAPEFD